MRRKVLIEFAECAVDFRRLGSWPQDEAIDVAAEAQRRKAGTTIGRRVAIAVAPSKPLIVDILDRRRIDVLDPAGCQILAQRLLGRHPHRRRAAAPAPPPSLTPSTAWAVLSSVKPSGAVKVKPSLGCKEATAAHKAFARILAVDQPVDAAQIVGLVAHAAAGGGELARIGAWRCEPAPALPDARTESRARADRLRGRTASGRRCGPSR